MRVANKFKLAAVIFGAVLAHGVQAGAIGTASSNDVTLEGMAASALEYSSDVNPQGKAGASGFSSAFESAGLSNTWLPIGLFIANNNQASPAAFPGSLSMSFVNDDNQGTWAIRNNDAENDLKLDLVFAMHVGGGSGAWLFDDQTVLAGSTMSGTWTQNMLNNGGQVAGYSNLTLFARDVSFMRTQALPSDGAPTELTDAPSANVPEPKTMAMMLAGLGLIGFVSRRRKVAAK